MKEVIVHEGKAIVVVPKADVPSRKMPVFYNPVMQVNRDITVILLNSVEQKNMRIADPLAGMSLTCFILFSYSTPILRT